MNNEQGMAPYRANILLCSTSAEKRKLIQPEKPQNI